MKFKQYGLQRSGTNITKVLIEENFGVRCYQNFPQNKHEVAPSEMLVKSLKSYDLDKLAITADEYAEYLDAFKRNQVFYVFTIRPLGPWLLGYSRWLLPKPNNKFSDFDHDFLVHALSKYKMYNLSYLRYHKKNRLTTQVVSHLDILNGDASWLLEVAKKANLNFLSGSPIGTVSYYAKQGTDKQRGLQAINQGLQFQHEEKLKLTEQWHDSLPSWAVDYVNAWADNVSKKYPALSNYIY